ncbi:MAG: MBL fold metallo-hydrolase [Bacteroidales bacterium]|jgi:L-ascorbate metabolism protein UlaG (beta-lactamase superfamily)|nr:MBL fold metallo-hydrolase [Bacteroidales bacterium]
MKKNLKWLLISFLISILILIAAFMIIPKIAPQFGANASGARLEKIENSPHFKDGQFQNLVETPMYGENTSLWQSFAKFIRGGKNREPSHTIETPELEINSIAADEVSVTWFGHSTVLMQIAGKKLLIDPVFSNHTSPFAFMGPKAFPYSHQYSIDDLPEIDAVIISHDHYDHLDYESTLKLKKLVSRFYVPLGLGAHLEKWGIPSENITEAEWWDEFQFDQEILLACVPMRHFSGRGIADRNKTLWAGWVIKSENHTVIHTGDSGYGPHFKQIGEKYGPFDLTMVECGQYNEGWPYIHMTPEETVQAHIDLKGNMLLPIHWGRFNLSLHAWTDPVERASATSNQKHINLITPVPGQLVNISDPMAYYEWWQ